MPALREGVFESCCSEKYQRFCPMGGADDPGTIVDDITPEDAIDCTGALLISLFL